MSAQTEATATKPALPKKIGVLIFPAFEPLDVMGPIEALQTLSWTNKLELCVIAPTLDTVGTALPETGPSVSGPAFGVRLVPTHTFATVPADLDVLIVPGGYGATLPATVAPAAEFVKKTYPGLQYLITVCNGVAIAAAAGVLDRKTATGDKVLWNAITSAAPKVKWVKHARYTVDGNIWTSSGVSAGIDATLAWIKAVFGEERARKTANVMEYEWKDDKSWDPFAYVWAEDIDLNNL
ncbi:class I glutamine amidotransferase-like protein [Daedaleopsis nitida]|nr:class I glutamine amidotransferase-like protein [Daedaleopsis nitida]